MGVFANHPSRSHCGSSQRAPTPQRGGRGAGGIRCAAPQPPAAPRGAGVPTWIRVCFPCRYRSRWCFSAGRVPAPRTDVACAVAELCRVQKPVASAGREWGCTAPGRAEHRGAKPVPEARLQPRDPLKSKSWERRS